ncbi:MAG: YbaK/EbsC family protein [bacterium]|nr:YbaK/EbsC family protein [bacterium]
MNKQEVYDFIKNKGIDCEINEHKAVFKFEEVSNTESLYPGYDTKNLLVRDDKKQNYYLITIKGNKRVDLKEFRSKYETRALSFAKEDELKAILNLTFGNVNPFGLLNDNDLKVTFCLDKEFLDKKDIIGIPPNDNTATVWLKVSDLLSIIKEHGNPIKIVEL